MPPCTLPDAFASSLTLLSPAVAGLLSATALWVASRARSTFKDEQRILSSLVTSAQRSDGSPEVRGSRRGAPARKRSSTKGTTST